MPIYKYKCVKCKREWESFSTVAERYNIKCCKITPKILIDIKTKPVVYNYYDEELESFVTGPKDKKRKEKAMGLTCRSDYY